MASYVESVLSEGERVVYVARVSLWAMTGWIVGGLILLPLWGAELILWLIAYIRFRSTELAITDMRVITKFGFVGRHTVEVNLQKVESVQVTQSVFGRLFDFGSLIVSGGGTPQAPVPFISDPLSFRRAFMAAQEEALRNAGRP